MTKTKVYVLGIMMSFAHLSASAQAKVVISQIYGGAGCGTAGCSSYKNDYIEIFNAGDAAQNLNGWAIQYTAATGTAWQITALSNFTLQPGQFYLIAQGAGSNGVNTIPTPNVSGVIAMSATACKVALTNNTTVLSGLCPVGTAIVDFVGVGVTASCREGSGNASSPSVTTALFRAGNGCTDANNNSTDFVVNTPAPRNSATAAAICSTLPVTFLSYNAQYQPAENVVILSWITSLEQNASKFIIERSGDGSTWSMIDIVTAVGNSNLENRYQAKDPKPDRGVNFYRIKQVDIDGSFIYTRVVSITTNAPNAQFTVSPNPTTGSIFINTNIASNKPVNVQVIDANGKVVLKENHFFTGAQGFRLDLSRFGKGTYIISLLADQIKSTEKVMVY